MVSKTLRELNGLDQTPASLGNATLVLIDYQNTYTEGVMELDGWRPALDTAGDLLDRVRAAGGSVIHVMHDGGEGSPYDIREDIGRIHPRVAPAAGEEVIVKEAPNAFVGTELEARIADTGNQDVIVAGFMTHMCVTFTAEGAFLRGLRPTVVADACATRSLRSPAGTVSAEQLHSSALATIGDLYGVVVSTADELD